MIIHTILLLVRGQGSGRGDGLGRTRRLSTTKVLLTSRERGDGLSHSMVIKAFVMGQIRLDFA